MVLVAPQTQTPSDVHDPRTIDDLVIKEAKRRARRRRRRYGLVAVGVTALVGASVFAALGRTPPSRGSASAAPTTAGSTTAGSFGACLSPGQVPVLSAHTPGGPPPIANGTDGFIGGPVSDPRPGGAPCRLVLQQYSHGNFGASRLGVVSLFSDGRVITSEGGGYYTRLTLVERQLTTEGVEQVRRMAVSLLTEVPPQSRHALGGGLMPEAQIFYQGRNHWSSDFAKFSDKLFDLSWLPDDAWLRKEPQPYQPDWWEACYRGDGMAVDRQRLLDRLPADAAAVLRDKETATRPSSWEDGLGTHEAVMNCTVVSTAERKVLVQALHAAGYPIEGYLLGRIDLSPVEIGTNPLLPDGESSAYGG